MSHNIFLTFSVLAQRLHSSTAESRVHVDGQRQSSDIHRVFSVLQNTNHAAQTPLFDLH